MHIAIELHFASQRSAGTARIALALISSSGHQICLHPSDSVDPARRCHPHSRRTTVASTSDMHEPHTGIVCEVNLCTTCCSPHLSAIRTNDRFHMRELRAVNNTRARQPTCPPAPLTPDKTRLLAGQTRASLHRLLPARGGIRPLHASKCLLTACTRGSCYSTAICIRRCVCAGTCRPRRRVSGDEFPPCELVAD